MVGADFWLKYNGASFCQTNAWSIFHKTIRWAVFKKSMRREMWFFSPSKHFFFYNLSLYRNPEYKSELRYQKDLSPLCLFPSRNPEIKSELRHITLRFATIFLCDEIQNSNLNFGTKKTFPHYVCLPHEIQKSNLNFDTVKSFPYVNISLKRYHK